MQSWAIGTAFWGSLISNRVISIFRRRRPWNTVLNVIAILPLLAMIGIVDDPFTMIFIVMASLIITFVSALSVTFARIKLDLLKEILSSPEPEGELDPSVPVCEIMAGTESRAAAVMMESTMAESGMCAPVVHDKYNFCHGRINLSCAMDSQLVFFRDRTELDELMDRYDLPRYGNVVVLERKYDDPVVNDFWLCLQCLRLCRRLALKKGVDLSSIEEHPDNDRFYLFDGEM